MSQSNGSVTAKSKVKPSSPKKYNQQSLVALAAHGKNMQGAQPGADEDSSEDANDANKANAEEMKYGKKDSKNITFSSAKLIKQEKDKGG